MYLIARRVSPLNGRLPAASSRALSTSSAPWPCNASRSSATELMPTRESFVTAASAMDAFHCGFALQNSARRSASSLATWSRASISVASLSSSDSMPNFLASTMAFRSAPKVAVDVDCSKRFAARSHLRTSSLCWAVSLSNMASRAISSASAASIVPDRSAASRVVSASSGGAWLISVLATRARPKTRLAASITAASTSSLTATVMANSKALSAPRSGRARQASASAIKRAWARRRRKACANAPAPRATQRGPCCAASPKNFVTARAATCSSNSAGSLMLPVQPLAAQASAKRNV
mmetsp:Transcript_6939/g.19571  ORF Transcript_6939/g.19571 Transcript_6939/m.19571 type:complete len:295 (-) Transcript_6939:978-1862(-)